MPPEALRCIQEALLLLRALLVDSSLRTAALDGLAGSHSSYAFLAASRRLALWPVPEQVQNAPI